MIVAVLTFYADLSITRSPADKGIIWEEFALGCVRL